MIVPTSAIEFSAVILAGGRSSRMGRDKALLEVEGQPLLERQLTLVRARRPVELFISGRTDTDYARWRCPVLRDRVADAGPLAGIAVSLEAARTSLLLVLAVDLPRMTGELLDGLLAACAPDCGVVPCLPGGPEPLAAVYPRKAAALAVEHLMVNRGAARAFAESCRRAGLVRFLDYPPEMGSCFANWNVPDDLNARTTGDGLASGAGGARRTGAV